MRYLRYRPRGLSSSFRDPPSPFSCRLFQIDSPSLLSPQIGRTRVQVLAFFLSPKFFFISPPPFPRPPSLRFFIAPSPARSLTSFALDETGGTSLLFLLLEDPSDRAFPFWATLARKFLSRGRHEFLPVPVFSLSLARLRPQILFWSFLEVSMKPKPPKSSYSSGISSLPPLFAFFSAFPVPQSPCRGPPFSFPLHGRSNYTRSVRRRFSFPPSHLPGVDLSAFPFFSRTKQEVGFWRLRCPFSCFR